MLKEDKSASFSKVTKSTTVCYFQAGPRAGIYKHKYLAHISRDDALRLFDHSKETPVKIAGVRVRGIGRQNHSTTDVKESDHLNWWMFREKVYFTRENDLAADDVKALALEDENKKRLQLEKAHALMAMRMQLDSRAKRQPIPQQVKIVVWQRDQGRCVECGSSSGMEYDHIIPLCMGGSNTARNLQLLCSTCNRRKGGSLG